MFVLCKLGKYISHKIDPKHKIITNWTSKSETLYECSINTIYVGMYKHATEKLGTVRMHCGNYTYEIVKNNFMNTVYHLEMRCYLYTKNYITISDVYNNHKFSGRSIGILPKENVIMIPHITYR